MCSSFSSPPGPPAQSASDWPGLLLASSGVGASRPYALVDQTVVPLRALQHCLSRLWVERNDMPTMSASLRPAARTPATVPCLVYCSQEQAVYTSASPPSSPHAAATSGFGMFTSMCILTPGHHTIQLCARTRVQQEAVQLAPLRRLPAGCQALPLPCSRLRPPVSAALAS